MFPKPKRIVNKKLLKDTSNNPCTVCGTYPSDPHHIKTRGSGGGDTASNLLALCRVHHVEIHKIGSRTFMKKYEIKS